MAQDLKDFWHRFQSGVDVAVAGSIPDKLLGVRDGFLRYFKERYQRAGPVRVVPYPQDERAAPLPLEDLAILELARERAQEVAQSDSESFAFRVGSESGLLTIRSGSEMRHFVRTWTVILGLGDEAWGTSGSVQLPQRLIHGLDQQKLPFAIPGTRRRGGMVSSLTGGLESPRSATALSTFNALSTLTYDLHERRPRRDDKTGKGGLYRV